ncbi:MAG: DUF1552 domain-containing protein [Acidobacteria bacterium]|nr:DUF1552 domain-containing protein [Acidobacteriota bacterium]
MTRHLSRRTLLRGLGAAVALPALDAMTPARVSAAPPRLAFVYVPNGIIMDQWTPAAEGAAFELPRVLQPFAPLREKTLLLSGLAQVNGRALGDGPGDHARAAATWLTGVHPRKTAGADIKNGISADQLAAQAIGANTRFASLELGIEHGRIVGNCDSGYSCAYSNSIAWRSAETPLPPEVNPRLVFERLFGTGDDSTNPFRKSILDYVRDDAASLQSTLGANDKRKLDEYLTSVREIEKRLDIAGKQAASMPKPDMEKPEGIPVDFEEHVTLMFDLLTVAFQTDSTRVATFMLGREGSNTTYRQIGVPDAHHGISHHRGDTEKIEKLTKINEYHALLFGRWLQKLAAAKDGDGSLLDHMTIVYGSSLADGNRHTHHDLPILLAGGMNGKLQLGRHVRYPKETPLTNLYLSLLDHAGVKPETLGDSTGRLTSL